jgi:NitT/TauT family transport system ATP-binding protein
MPEAPGQTVAPKLAVHGVTKIFHSRTGNVQALDNVTLSIADGEFVCLVGPSGCGKSTLLNIMAGLTHPDSGEVVTNGAQVSGPGRDRVVMFQDSALFPWLTALGNVMFGLNLLPHLTRAERLERAHHHLALVGLARFVHANVHELSGGMRQRVAFARALAPDPQVLLMDEPLSALDEMTREQLCMDIQRIQQERHKTIVLVTHNVREAVCLGDRVALFSPRPGRVRDIFTVDLIRPRDLNSVAVTEQALGISAALKGRLAEVEL